VGRRSWLCNIWALSLVSIGMESDKALMALAAMVLLHLVVTLAHGSAHASAGVTLGPAALAFVIVIIEVAPLAGLAWTRTNPRAGARTIAVAMTGALLFGLLNHFVIPGADHVHSVAASSRAWFGMTAALLVITEAAGTMLAMVYGLRLESVRA
jgi:hypothetical protein